MDVLRHAAQEADVHERESDQRILHLPRELADSLSRGWNLRYTHWTCLLLIVELVLNCVELAAVCHGSLDSSLPGRFQGSISVREFVVITSKIVPDLDQNVMAIHHGELEGGFLRKPVRLHRCGR